MVKSSCCLLTVLILRTYTPGIRIYRLQRINSPLISFLIPETLRFHSPVVSPAPQLLNHIIHDDNKMAALRIIFGLLAAETCLALNIRRHGWMFDVELEPYYTEECWSRDVISRNVEVEEPKCVSFDNPFGGFRYYVSTAETVLF